MVHGRRGISKRELKDEIEERLAEEDKRVRNLKERIESQDEG